ncbi:MAG TPA: hypothetical protein VNF99_01810 [Stellaceae bacterium]|nr:hypothetical protein [Stellaceae bacterium]
MKDIKADDVLAVVHGSLRRRYGDIETIVMQGVAKGQRVQVVDRAKPFRCVIKRSEGGRISFDRRPDGTWRGLSESDRVVIVAPTELDGDDQTISMFEQKVLLDAFEANYAAQSKAGMAHLPSWLAPFHEDGRGARGVGDGFGEKALWSEPLTSAPESSAVSAVSESMRALTFAEAKQGLAKKYGFPPDAFDISIRGD